MDPSTLLFHHLDPLVLHVALVTDLYRLVLCGKLILQHLDVLVHVNVHVLHLHALVLERWLAGGKLHLHLLVLGGEQVGGHLDLHVGVGDCLCLHVLVLGGE